MRATPVPVNAIAPTLVRFNAPVPEESSEPPPAPSVNRRSLLWPAPLYDRVAPLLMSRLLAAALLAPVPLLLPPSARQSTARVPPLMVVVPV
ncbi:hypothetical protein D3C84_1008840 [compost metagenome]